LAEELVRLCNQQREKIDIINMGVDLGEFHPIPKALARDELGLGRESNRCLVIFVGNLVRVKGVPYLIEAASALKQKGFGKDFMIYLVGHGPEERPLKELAQRVGVNDLVRFVGNKPPGQIPLWMAAADVVVIPSLAEGFVLVSIEAMACGRPVIGTRISGLAETIIDGENGFFVEPGNSQDLADKLERFLADPNWFESHLESIIETARKHDAERQAGKVHQIYERLQGQPEVA
jgi:glycosyltransferase involved in cell wall biosynthesis